MRKILITGCAGFIGSNLVDRLLKEGYYIVGVDNFNDYYSPKIKEANLKRAQRFKTFRLYREDILNFEGLQKIFDSEQPQKVVHLAARAGVRSSIGNPLLYATVNILGTVNLLKLAVDFKIDQFIFGSSSSVYGNSTRLPFSEDNLCDVIVSPYGASKRAAEFWVESFNRTYGLDSITLRFFTVYGPRGRPDMAPAIFSETIINEKLLKFFGDGSTSRDYTYIDDIVDGIIKTLNRQSDFKIFNLGNSNSVNLNRFVKTLEILIGKKAKIKKLPKVPFESEKTWADIRRAKNLLGWNPKVNLEYGLKKYLNWLSSQNLQKS